MTRRQQIAELLRTTRSSAEVIARSLGVPVRTVLLDLAHVRRGLRPPERWITHDAECHSCGFVFRGRERLDTPSRCPRCRSEDIRAPEFEVTGARA